MLSALLLAGCSVGTEKQEPAADPKPQARVEAPLPTPPRSKPRPAQVAAAPKTAPAGQAEQAGGGSGGTGAGRAAALGPEGSQAKAVSPKSLVGLDEAAMRRLLGEPTWAEDVPPGRYWQYASRSCVLRVFFFLEMDTQRYRALSYELTSTENAPDVDEQCFDQFLRQAPDGKAAFLDRP
ncbi:hypothetical protein [Arenibaculum pallidiluteum]|uniref:hypothetical protein n=1 Tax=Arenibaculum pallidiluteum TaxID=2812559 RepID=UPI001A95B42E|nr:hypothetical protein [Arenibaculum pallidiluteum]